MARGINQRGGYPGPMGDWAGWEPSGHRGDAGSTRRQFLFRSAAWIGALSGIGELVKAGGTVADYLSFNSETPSSTTVIPQLRVNLREVNIRNAAMITDGQDAPNTVKFDSLIAVGRKADGSKQLVNFDRTNPTVTLKDVPLVYGYNPDTGGDHGLWAAIPARFGETLLFPGIGQITKEGWIYVSISHQTEGDVQVPNNEFQNVEMSPNDPKAGVFASKSK